MERQCQLEWNNVVILILIIILIKLHIKIEEENYDLIETKVINFYF